MGRGDSALIKYIFSNAIVDELLDALYGAQYLAITKFE